MKYILSTIIITGSVLASYGQHLNVETSKEGIFNFNAETAGEMIYKNGESLEINGTDFDINEIEKIYVTSLQEGIVKKEYNKFYFDFAENIAKEKSELKLEPEDLDIPLKIVDASGTTGVKLVASLDNSNNKDYYLNAYVEGHALTLSTTENFTLKEIKSNKTGEIKIENNAANYVPQPINLIEGKKEVIEVTLNNGEQYRVHISNELLPYFELSTPGVADENKGIYEFTLDRFLLRVDSDGNLVYFRNMGSVGENISENFGKKPITGGEIYTYFVELHPDFRNFAGGYSSGMYVVMDENFKDIETLHFLPNDDPNHTHGMGYLDEHELVVIDKDHYLLYSCTPEYATNLPKEVRGIDGTKNAFVWAGKVQEIKDGKVIREISTTDYPLLYYSAVEMSDYENSTDKGKEIDMGGNMVVILSEGWMDYVHLNSLDYTLGDNGRVDKLLVSMRDQSAIYQIDFQTGNIEWILGGKSSIIHGYDDFSTMRKDEKGHEFRALTFGQHYARYVNKDADNKINGNPIISVFDNQTGDMPFLMALEVPTITRTFKAEIDNQSKTANIFDEIVGSHLNEKTGKYHNSSHCGSVIYVNGSSVVIGWGQHAIADMMGEDVPYGTLKDIGFDDLRIGSHPVFTEYDPANDKVTFELTAKRNKFSKYTDSFFSYRTYKTTK